MSEWLHLISWMPLTVGALFFVAGTAGLLRFPDMHCRLHAVTKADTLGLGLIVLGLSLRAAAWQPILMMLLIWILIMASGATVCQLLARYEHEQTDPHAKVPENTASSAPVPDNDASEIKEIND